MEPKLRDDVAGHDLSIVNGADGQDILGGDLGGRTDRLNDGRTRRIVTVGDSVGDSDDRPVILDASLGRQV